jgi:hypothetical protein
MGINPAASARRAANGEGEPHTFWQRIAQSIDTLVANRTKRTVPQIVLRRSQYDLDRCRRLILRAATAPAPVTLGGVQVRRARH